MAAEYPKLRLYRANGACSLVPHMVLRHLGIPFEETVIGRDGGAADGSFDAAAYKRDVNAAGEVPALAVGTGPDEVVVISQNAAILGYVVALAQQAGGHPAAAAAAALGGDPASLLERARVQQWLAYAASFVHARGFAPGYKPGAFVADAAAHAGVAAAGRQKIAAAFARFEAELSGAGFAVGRGLTTADFFLYLFWRWGQFPNFKVDLPGPYPRLEALARKVEELPGVREALETEGLERVFGE